MNTKMKKLISSICFLILCLFAINSSNAAVTNTDKGTITATATEEKLVAPDTATISFTIKTTDKNSQKASELNNEKVKNLTEQIKKILTTNESIKTSSYNISQKYEYNNVTKKSYIAGYIVTNVLTVTLKDTNKTGKVIEIATNSGVTEVHSLSFTIQSTNNICRELSQKAVIKAKQDAINILTPLGKTIDSIADIRYSCATSSNMSTYKNYSVKAMGTADSGENAISIEAGENKVKASVTIVFTIK